MSSLVDMGDNPDDVAEYLGGFVVDGEDGEEHVDDEVRRFALDIARFKAGGEEVPPSPARGGEGGVIDEGTTTTTTAALNFATMATAIAAKEDGRVQESRRDETTTARICFSPTTTGDGYEDTAKSDEVPPSSHEEALSTLQSIFSDRGYTSRHLDAVLRRWGGNIEDAVEALLLVHGDEVMPPDDEPPPGELPRTRSAAINRGVGGNGNGKKNGIDAKELARHLFVDVQGRHGASSSSNADDDDDDDPSYAMTSARDDGGGARADGRECRRSCVPIGAKVYVVKKEDQRTGRETPGVVSRHLTNSEYHPRGIKVMLADGTVGRVIKLAR
jgi:uncharacterized repeat protein (TIGR03833 family)